MDAHSEAGSTEHKQPNYFGVFIVLAVLTGMITTVELLVRADVIGWPRPVINSFYLSMSLVKALLVVLYYMHLKYDSRLYAVMFGLPCIFAVVFFTLLLI
jgi:cytochrome c oxidase subunit 4